MLRFSDNHPDSLFETIVKDNKYAGCFNTNGLIKDLYGAGKAPEIYSETRTIEIPLAGFFGHSGNIPKYLNTNIFSDHDILNIGTSSQNHSVNPDDKYMRTISFSGDMEPEYKATLLEIDNFLEKSNVYEELDKLLSGFGYKNLDVRLDKGLKPHIMGMTNCRGAEPYCDITLNPKLYSQTYTKIRDKNAQLIVKYLQAGTLMHEWVHKRTISSSKGSVAAENLLRMGYSEENVRGFLEMLAEVYTIKAFENAGQHALAHIGKMYSPYRAAYLMGERIESVYKKEPKEEYELKDRRSDEKVGMEGFMHDLWSGNLSYTDANKFIKPLSVKAPEAAYYQDKNMHVSGCGANSCRVHETQYRCT